VSENRTSGKWLLPTPKHLEAQQLPACSNAEEWSMDVPVDVGRWSRWRRGTEVRCGGHQLVGPGVGIWEEGN
jgi:hypothetical protein